MKPILLLHGALGDEYQLIDLQKKLTPMLECYPFNFYGHGEDGENKKPLSIPEMAQQVRAYIISNNLQGIAVFGYSMGGFVAMYLARFFPETIGPIITYGTKYDWNKETAKKEADFLNPDFLMVKTPSFVQMLESRHGDNWKNVLKRTATFLLKLGDNPILHETDMQFIQHPVLTLHGGKDFTANAETSILVSQLLIDGEYEELPNQPHAIERVDKDVLAKQILTFLQ